MRPEESTNRHLDVDVLFALAVGELSEREAYLANAHLAQCRGCRRLYSGARQLQADALHMGDAAAASVDDMTRQRIWREVARDAVAAAERVQRRQAWRLVARSPVARVAAVLLVLVASGGAHWAFRAGDEGDREGVAEGSLTASARAAGESGTGAAGPGSSSRLARSLRGSRGGQGASGSSPARRARIQRSRSRSMASMDLDLTGPLPGPGPGGATAAPGEQVLRCGGVLRLGGAVAQVVMDKRRSALIRLKSGRVSLSVPRLPPGGRLLVVTSDARVRVVGTRFSVRTGGPASASKAAGTTVTVKEGVVWVTPTGRNRKTLVLRAGDSQTVLGELAYLKGLLRQLKRAIGRGRLEEAASHGRRYLEVVTDPRRSTGMRLRLAGILARLGRSDEAARLYMRVVSGGSHAVARQNALAFLARLYERMGQGKRAMAAWTRLLKGYPRGLFAVDALMALVRAGCKEPGRSQERHRRQLATRAGSSRVARALLLRCKPSGGHR